MLRANSREDVQQPMVNLDMLWYASQFSFDFRIMVHDEAFNTVVLANHVLIPNGGGFNPFYTELVLVNSAAEAAELPPHIVAAWPNEARSERLLASLNQMISRTEEDIRAIGGQPPRRIINLEDFDLTYPLTVIDLVDNWESVNKLFQTIHHADQNTLRRVGGILTGDTLFSW